jgi:hypothetical protein
VLDHGENVPPKNHGTFYYGTFHHRTTIVKLTAAFRVYHGTIVQTQKPWYTIPWYYPAKISQVFKVVHLYHVYQLYLGIPW